MRGIFYVLAALGVIGLAFWAYGETHKTQRALAELRQTQAEVSSLREALGVQRAEWAYLNRPARLRELAELNFDGLGLMPLLPEHFGSVDQVAYPAPELPALNQPVETFGAIDGVTPLLAPRPGTDTPQPEVMEP